MSLLIWMISFIFSLIHTTGFIPKTTTMFFMANTKYCRNGRSTEKQKEKVSHVKNTTAVKRYPRNRLSFIYYYLLTAGRIKVLLRRLKRLLTLVKKGSWSSAWALVRNPNAQRPMTSKVRHWKRLKKMDGRIISAWQQTNTSTKS